MSWQSNKTGRPKEDGGHRRINISIDKPTYDALQEVGNVSKFIEYCVEAFGQSRWIGFFEPKETMNNDQNSFKTAATVVWTPIHRENNAILSTRCWFQCRCTGQTFRFRMVINGKSSRNIKLHAESGYTWVQFIYDCDFDSSKSVKILSNQDSYVIEFQFKPQAYSDVAYIKDINIFLKVAEGMPALLL